MKKFELNRKQYQAVRKMDHNQMQEYFRKVYEDGYQAGEKEAVANVEPPDLTGLEEELQEIRGIGGAKARAVCEAVKLFFESKVSA